MVKKLIDFIKEISPYILIGMIATYGFAFYKFKDNIKTPPVGMPTIEEQENKNGLKKIDRSKPMKLEDFYIEL